MELRFWAATDTGRVRDHNEDNFLVDKRLQLFVVCDGMGGHAAGEVASAVCVRTVRDVIAEQNELLNRLAENPDDEADRKNLQDLMGRAIRMACTRIFEMAKQDSNRHGMGTTCTALVMVGSRGYIGHVGDSRLYRLRKEKVGQITNDHSLLNEMIRQGKIPADTTEAEFPHNNAVTRAVGVREMVEVDTMEFNVASEDRLLMCSDGLSEYLADVDKVEIMGAGEPEETTKICIDHANASGGKDNITVIIIDCVEEAAESKEEAAQVIEILRNTTYFHYLAPAELEHLRKMAARIELEAEEMVVGEHEANDRLFIILKGSVSLQLEGRQVSVLTTGENFGEMALIDAQDEQDTNLVAQTLEPTVMLSIARDQFVGLLRTEPGLAIKLLWNFVQVFADRLQSVPPEYRFTPDDWRQEPEAVGDITPPSGSLVFKEDLRRLEKRTKQPDPPPLDEGSKIPARPPTITSVSDDSDSEAADLSKTMDLGMFDPDLMESAAPRAGAKTSPMSKDKPSRSEPPPMNFQAPDDEEEEQPLRKGLNSGTYDSKLLAGGVSGKMKIDEHSGMASFGEGAGDPNTTLNPWDSPSSSDTEEGDVSNAPPEELAATVGLDADIDELRSLRKHTAESLKDKLRRRREKRPNPGSEILKKANKVSPSLKAGALGPDEVTRELDQLTQADLAERRGSSKNEKQERSQEGRAGMAGESSVQAGSGAGRQSKEEPKVMISPDLMADLDDD